MTGTPLPPPPMFNNGKKVDNPNPVLPSFPSNKPIEEKSVVEEIPTTADISAEPESDQQEKVESIGNTKKEKKPLFSKKSSKNKVREEVVNEEVLTVDETKPVSATDFDELLRKPENENNSETLLEEKVPNRNRKLGMGIFGGLSVVLIGAIVYAVGTINGLF